jgi:hypothetical protein
MASLLFGVAHLLNPFNPFAGRLSLDWRMGIMTVVYGFFFGFMREKTGSIVMPAIVHGANFAYYLFPSSTLGFAVAWLINGMLLFRIFSRSSARAFLRAGFLAACLVTLQPVCAAQTGVSCPPTAASILHL